VQRRPGVEHGRQLGAARDRLNEAGAIGGAVRHREDNEHLTGRYPAACSAASCTAPLRLSWTDGSPWELDIPSGEARKAHALVDLLGSTA